MPYEKSTILYEDTRTGRQWRETKIIEVPGDEIDSIRKKELAAFYGNQSQSLVPYKSGAQDQSNDNGAAYYANRRIAKTQRSVDNYNGYAGSNARGNYDDQQLSRRNTLRDNQGSDSRDGRSRVSRRQRARSEDRSQNQGSNQKQGRDRDRNRDRPYDGPPNSNQWEQENGKNRPIPLNKDYLGVDDKAGQMWYTGQDRDEANFVEKHFDSSPDGLLAAAAGAAIGAMGVNRLGLGYSATEEDSRAQTKKQRWKTIAGAVVGAAAFNVGEAYLRVKMEKDEDKKENLMTGIEAICEGGAFIK